MQRMRKGCNNANKKSEVIIMLKKETLVEMMQQDLKGAEDAYFEAKEKMTLREVDKLWKQLPVEKEKAWVAEQLEGVMVRKLLRVDELADYLSEWAEWQNIDIEQDLDEEIVTAFLTAHVNEMYLSPLATFYVVAVEFYNNWYAYELIETSIRTNKKYRKLVQKILEQF